ncbi:MAG: sigma-70 family RNA polymerase sigma factor [Candidatus Tectomicrobia bacterium]|nr:sigma-70 family RNA polymerase sigma factor [Candidatus Tectomicrobia bacterium]
MINVEHYYGLVIYHAKKLHAALSTAGKGESEIELQEFIQEGFIGLLEARRRYEPQRGIAFATFATPRITGAMVDFLRKRDPLASRERQRVKELDQVKEDLTQSLGRVPTIDALAHALDLTTEDVRKIEALRIMVLPLDHLSWDENAASAPAAWEASSPRPDPEKVVATTQLHEDVEVCLGEALHENERSVLIPRMVGKTTLQALGQVLDIPTATVHRREVSAKKKLRHCLETKGWDVTDI